MELISEENKIELNIFNLLKEVIDPELAINIIDMGLVYDISFTVENGIVVNLTLSSEGCPMGDVILEDVKNVIKENYPETKQKVNLVWEPKWNSTFITPSGRKTLNMD